MNGAKKKRSGAIALHHPLIKPENWDILSVP
jgi:hypothetical protein